MRSTLFSAAVEDKAFGAHSPPSQDSHIFDTVVDMENKNLRGWFDFFRKNHRETIAPELNDSSARQSLSSTEKGTVKPLTPEQIISQEEQQKLDRIISTFDTAFDVLTTGIMAVNDINEYNSVRHALDRTKSWPTPDYPHSVPDNPHDGVKKKFLSLLHEELHPSELSAEMFALWSSFAKIYDILQPDISSLGETSKERVFNHLQKKVEELLRNYENRKIAFLAVQNFYTLCHELALEETVGLVEMLKKPLIKSELEEAKEKWSAAVIDAKNRFNSRVKLLTSNSQVQQKSMADSPKEVITPSDLMDRVLPAGLYFLADGSQYYWQQKPHIALLPAPDGVDPRPLELPVSVVDTLAQLTYSEIPKEEPTPAQKDWERTIDEFFNRGFAEVQADQKAEKDTEFLQQLAATEGLKRLVEISGSKSPGEIRGWLMQETAWFQNVYLHGDVFPTMQEAIQSRDLDQWWQLDSDPNSLQDIQSGKKSVLKATSEVKSWELEASKNPHRIDLVKKDNRAKRYLKLCTLLFEALNQDVDTRRSILEEQGVVFADTSELVKLNVQINEAVLYWLYIA